MPPAWDPPKLLLVVVSGLHVVVGTSRVVVVVINGGVWLLDSNVVRLEVQTARPGWSERCGSMARWRWPDEKDDDGVGDAAPWLSLVSETDEAGHDGPPGRAPA